MATSQFNMRLDPDTRAQLEKNARGKPLSVFLINRGLAGDADVIDAMRKEIEVRDRELAKQRVLIREMRESFSRYLETIDDLLK